MVQTMDQKKNPIMKRKLLDQMGRKLRGRKRKVSVKSEI